MIGGNELEILGIAAQHGGMRLRQSFTTVNTKFVQVINHLGKRISDIPVSTFSREGQAEE